MRNKKVVYLTHAAVIAALYAVLTIAQNNLIPGSASAAIQFRVAEALCVLAIYTPAAIPGLTIGCIIANISSVAAGLGVYDMVFGSIASLLAALTMYGLRNVRLANLPSVAARYRDNKSSFAYILLNLPVLAALMPALFNGIIVGFEIDFFFVGSMSFNFVDFLIQGGCVAVGELAVLFILGLPLTVLLDKRGVQMGITAPKEKSKEKKTT